MINITPPSPIKPKVERTQVSDKDPHREKGNKKKDKKDDDNIQDEISLSSDKDKETKKSKSSTSPLIGNIDIEA